MTRQKIQRPDHRNNGKYQFVVWYAASGGEGCVHLSREEIIQRCTEKAGPGVLIDDGVDLWWEQEQEGIPEESGEKC